MLFSYKILHAQLVVAKGCGLVTSADRFGHLMIAGVMPSGKIVTCSNCSSSRRAAARNCTGDIPSLPEKLCERAADWFPGRPVSKTVHIIVLLS